MELDEHRAGDGGSKQRHLKEVAIEVSKMTRVGDTRLTHCRET